MRRESLRRDELAFRREPFDWPIDTPPPLVLARVEARAAQLRRRRHMAVAAPLPLVLILTLLLAMTPSLPRGERVRTAPPAGQGDVVDAAPTDRATAPSADASSAGLVGVRHQNADADDDDRDATTHPTWPMTSGHEQSAPVSTPSGPPLPATGRGAFVRYARLWVVNADGTDERPITPEGERWGEPDWAADGRLIAIQYGAVADRRAVVIDVDRGRQRALPNSADIFGPQWSPDGEWIAFAAKAPDAAMNEHAAVWVMRPDGSGRRMVSRAAGTPSWLDPDRLVFQTPAGTEVVRVDGRGRRLLSTEFYNLVASPDSSRVLGMRVEDSGWTLYDMRPDLSDARLVIHRHNMTYDWSPDGEWVAVERETSVLMCPPVENIVCRQQSFNIWLVRRDGTGMRQLTTGKYDNSLAFGPPAPA